MHCGSISIPTKLLKNILEDDSKNIQSCMKEHVNVNMLLHFTDDTRQNKKCSFTPLATALLYGSEEVLRIILEAGGDIYKLCRFDSVDDSPCVHGDSDLINMVTITRMEPAILLTRFLCQFRNGDRWHLLIPLCEAGLDPVRPSILTVLQPEEEGGSMEFQTTTTVLDEVYVKMSPKDFDHLLSYCDIGQYFGRKNNVERFFDMILCPVRTNFAKFSSFVIHGFQDLTPYPINTDLLCEIIAERTASSQYNSEHIYLDIFRRIRTLMLVCGFRMISLVDYKAVGFGTFGDDDLWNGVESYVLTFMARMQDIVFKWNSTPKLLTILCRDVIRRAIRGPYFLKHVQQLNLPKLLEDFVVLPSNRMWDKMGMRALDDDYDQGLPDNQGETRYG